MFLSVVFFGLFGILTVVIKYLQIIVDLVFKRKRYSFEEIEKLRSCRIRPFEGGEENSAK